MVACRTWRPFEKPFKGHADHNSDSWAREVDPGGGIVAAQDVRRQRAEWVHRCTARRAGPELRDNNIAADRNRVIRARVAGVMRRTQNCLYQSCRQQNLKPKRLPIADPLARRCGAFTDQIAK